MPARRYSEELIDQAMTLRERGLTFGQIANKTGMKAQAVQHHCLMRGVDPPATADKPHVYNGPMTYLRNGILVRRFTPDEDRQILAMALQGLSRREIARQMGRKNHSVTTRLAALARRDQRIERAQTQKRDAA